MMGRRAAPSVNYTRDLLARAGAQYPFIRQYNPVVTLGKGEDYAETWPVGEEGAPEYPRPHDIPIDRVGVQVFRPGSFGPSDLAAEFLHIDPFANYTRGSLQDSMSPQQLSQLKQESGDYADTLKQGGTPEHALSNAVDSAMRGYTVGQWPSDANSRMGYTPTQTSDLQHLQQYMKTGVYPLRYSLPPGAGSANRSGGSLSE